ncbi:hypothetical protein T492DRAFT_289250 [Pavlovales sp. CCMP2436]|nr:hypothetical protein T492DRAFT_289250 [Pavlovales sp. CCMP2436]
MRSTQPVSPRVDNDVGAWPHQEAGEVAVAPAGAVLSIIQAHLAAAARAEQAGVCAQTPPTMIRAPSPREHEAAGSGTLLFQYGAPADAPPSTTDPAGAPGAPSASTERAAEATTSNDVARLEQLIQAIMANERLAVAENGSVSRAASEARAQLQLVGIGGASASWAPVDLGQPLLPPLLSRRLDSERAAGRARPGLFARLFGYGDETEELSWADDRSAAITV